MEASQKRTGSDGFRDVSDGGVSVIGGGDIIQRQKNAGDDLRDKNEQQPGTKDVSEARAARDRFIQGGPEQGVQTGAPV
jgi:hypothetical protein